MLSTIAAIWLTFSIIGQSCLLLVLLTLAFIKSLPQRKNPVFVNFMLTTFLAQIPPILLFITGHLNDRPPEVLCLVQSILMDGVAPLFGVALVALVFQTWVELRSIMLGIVPFTIKFTSIRIIVLLAPYIAMVSWCICSLAMAVQVPADLGLTQTVYCANNSMPGTRLRRSVGFFMLTLGIIEFSIEACIGRLVFTYFLNDRRRARNNSIINFHFVGRVFMLCFLQLVPIVLATLNSLLRLNSQHLLDGTHILESMNALVTFLVFGTSSELLQAWGVKKRQSTEATVECLAEMDESVWVIDVA